MASSSDTTPQHTFQMEFCNNTKALSVKFSQAPSSLSVVATTPASDCSASPPPPPSSSYEIDGSSGEDSLLQYHNVIEEPSAEQMAAFRSIYAKEINEHFPNGANDAELMSLMPIIGGGQMSDDEDDDDDDEEEDEDDDGDDGEERGVDEPKRRRSKSSIEDISEAELQRLEETDKEGRTAIDKELAKHPELTRKMLWMLRISGAFSVCDEKRKWGLYRQRYRAYSSFNEEQEQMELERNQKLSKRLAIERATAHEIDRILSLLPVDVEEKESIVAAAAAADAPMDD